MNNCLTNDQISAKTIKLVDFNGNKTKTISLEDAKDLANEQNLDLVLIQEQSDIPICKIMDYSKYKYEQMKREKENKKNNRQLQVKEIRLSCKIEQHDLETKANQARKFISKGHKINVIIKFKGRESLHPEIATKKINDFFKLINDVAKIEKRFNDDQAVYAVIAKI